MRWKIVLPNLLIVLIIGVAGWLYVRSYYTEYFDTQSRETLERDRNLFVAVKQLGAVNFLRTVMSRSRDSGVEGIFTTMTDEELAAIRDNGEEASADTATDDELMRVLRTRAHKQCEAFRTLLGSEESIGRTPDIVAITDRNGIVLSRDVDINAEPVGQDFSKVYPSVRRALQGNAVHDLWFRTEYLLDVAIAPIHNRGSVVGALIVGYDISNGEAQRDREMFGADVVYMLQDNNQWQLHSSSIIEGANRQSLVQGISEQQQNLQQSIANRDSAEFITISINGVDHIGLAGTLSSTDSSIPAGYVLLNSVQDVRAPASRSIFIFFFSLVGVLLVVIFGFVLGGHFLKPVEEIEEGVLRIINGDVSHRFEVQSSEFGGLAYRVNQLVAVLTGEEEETEEESNIGSPGQ